MFKKAVKTSAKLRMAIAGPSGSGKTYTSLAIAVALAGDKPVAVVDTEHGSASKYADIFEFDVAEMHAPFHPDKYVQAIVAAAEAGYGVIILDSMTHAWQGEGGLLEIVDGIAKRSKSTNSYAAWKDATPIQNRMVEAMLSADIHIIATVRSKQDYSMEKDNNGRTTIRKVGMAPVQRDGFEYEFDVFLDMDMDNNGIVSKSRCPQLSGGVFAKPGRNVADILRKWLSGEAPAQSTQDARPAPANGAHSGAAADITVDDAEPVEVPPAANPFEDDAQPWQQWSNVKQACEWGQAQGVFNAYTHAKNAYELVKNAYTEQCAEAGETVTRDGVFKAWQDDVLMRVYVQAEEMAEAEAVTA